MAPVQSKDGSVPKPATRNAPALPATMDIHSNPRIPLAKPNYSFEKRQRELAKKKKKEAKLAKKQGDRDTESPADTPDPSQPQ